MLLNVRIRQFAIEYVYYSMHSLSGYLLKSNDGLTSPGHHEYDISHYFVKY